MGRKRQRSRTGLTDEDEQPIDVIDDSESTQDPSQADEPAEDEERKMEVDVWDAFKEEHHEGPSPTPPRRAHALICC